MNMLTKFQYPLQLLSHFLFQASVWIWWVFLLWAITAEHWVKDTNEVQIFKMLSQKSYAVNALKALTVIFFFFFQAGHFIQTVFGEKFKSGSSQAVCSILNASWCRLDFLIGSFFIVLCCFWNAKQRGCSTVDMQTWTLALQTVKERQQCHLMSWFVTAEPSTWFKSNTFWEECCGLSPPCFLGLFPLGQKQPEMNLKLILLQMSLGA